MNVPTQNATTQPGDESRFDDDTIDLVDVLAADLLARHREGERPTVEEYAKRHPEIADAIRHYFPLILSVERLKLVEQTTPTGTVTLAGKQLDRLGDFRIVGEIGRGGMGIVFEAVQESLARHVAVKVLPQQMLIDEKALDRFRREAKTAARLHHPNIVPVLGTGSREGTHYLVMQLVEGESLDQWIESTVEHRPTPLDVSEIAKVGVQVADALAYAHEHQVLHRDIKPSNLIRQSNGDVQLTDFGLACTIDDVNTQSRSLAGSIRYMPPERFRGVSDKRGDVYSLGLTLYELCIGAPAIEGSDASELMKNITSTSPRPLLERKPGLPRDLATIIHHAINIDPEHRYQSASDLRDDLRRFLADKPIRARPVSAVEKLVRWARRNPMLATTSGLAIVGMLATTIASTTGFLMAKQANKRTTTALEQSKRTVNLALESLDGVVDSVSLPLDSLTGIEGDADAREALPVFTLDPSPQTAQLLERIQPIYEQLSQQAPGQGEVILQAADAGIRLAQIQYQLGRTTDAIETLQNALDQLDRLPDSEIAFAHEAKLRRAHALNELGILYGAHQSSDEATLSHERAIETAAGLPDDGQIEVGRAHLFLAELKARRRLNANVDASASRSNRDSASQHADQAIEVFTMLRRDSPNDRTLDIWLARAFLIRAKQSGVSGERRADSAEAIKILRALDTDTKHPVVRFELIRALADVNVRRINDDSGQRQRAQRRLDEALELSAGLNSTYPNTPIFTRAQVHILHKLSALSRAQQHWSEAEEELAAAIELQTQLVDQFPEAVHHRCWRALLYRSLSEVPSQQTHATQLLAQAASDLEAAHANSRGNPLYRHAKQAVEDSRKQLNAGQ